MKNKTKKELLEMIDILEMEVDLAHCEIVELEDGLKREKNKNKKLKVKVRKLKHEFSGGK